MKLKKEAKAKENMKKKRKKSKLKRFIGICFILFILLGVGTATVIWISTQNAINKFTESGLTEEIIDPLSAVALGLDAKKLASLERINVLVMGESGIGDGYNLTDSIMVASYNPQTQQAAILSIPRDTYVGKKDKNSASQNYLASYKVNAAYRNGENIPETVELVGNLTGIDLEYYILIDTNAVISLVDTVGGITFNVPIDMDYDDDTQDLHIHLQAGEQLIDGEKAEQLLRFRHNNDGSSYPTEYGDNDLGRMRTQREFIQEAARQLIKIENVPKAVSIMDIVFKNIRTNIDFETAKYYIPYIFKFNAENIVSDMVPGVPEKVNGIWIYSANKAQTLQVVEDLFTDRVYEEEENTEGTATNTVGETTANIDEEKTTVELLNGTGKKELLTKAKEQLKNAGYNVTKSGETSETEKTMIINRTKQASSVSKDIKETIGNGSITSGSDNSKVDYTVIIGQDYE